MSFASHLLAPTLERSRKLRGVLAEGSQKRRPEPGWSTPHEEVLALPTMKLVRFSPPGKRSAELDPRPLVIVTPEVNQAQIVDFAANQSLVRTAWKAGFADVYVVAWRSAGAAQRELTLDDNMRDVLTVFEHLKGEQGAPHVLGVCEGGWLSAAALSLRPQAASSLILTVSAIDFRAGYGPITQLTDMQPMAAYQAWVALGGGVMRGDLIASGFDNLIPIETQLTSWLRLWNQWEDKAAMRSYRRIEEWMRSDKNLPGPAYLQIVQWLFKENRLIEGRLELLGEKVDLSRIAVPVAMVAGARDHITLPEQVFAVEEHLDPALPRRRWALRGGHVGTFMGRGVLKRDWPEVFAWIREQTNPASPAGAEETGVEAS